MKNLSEDKPKKQKLSTEPYKGARDFYPPEKLVQNHIFNIWRETAKSFGYQEYDAPLLERLEIYQAKSGEELIKNQIYSMEDRGGRKIAIRPEKTPSVARMVASKLPALPRPIRWFNIGNCWRYEKPQKGRGREFYQFDCDIFGLNSALADVEVLSIPLVVMQKLGATKEMFELRVNNRKFAEFYLGEVLGIPGKISQKDTPLYWVSKAIDASPKISDKEFTQFMEEKGVSLEQQQKVKQYLNSGLDLVKNYPNQGAKEILDFFDLMEKIGYKEFIKYDPRIMRGLDYYTGIVVEQFDLNPKNNRAMYGGGRYDNLVELFSDEKLPGVGFAMGDITLLEFLEGWGLMPKLTQELDYFVTIWPSSNEEEQKEFIAQSMWISQKLRKMRKSCVTCMENNYSISQQLRIASKKGARKVVIIGPEELRTKKILIKDLSLETQESLPLEAFL